MVPVSLSWLLDRRDLGLRQLAGPTEGVEIAWAHPVELVDPTPWISGHELIMTTGLRLPRSARELDAYVERLADKGVAALALGTGVHLATTPAALIRSCEERALPLIEVPLPTPFVAVSRSIADELANRQLEDLRRSVDHQKRATRAALRRGVPGVVDVLHRELGVQAVLFDEHGGVIAETPDSASMVAAVRRRRERARIGNLIFDAAHGVIEMQSVPGRTSGRGSFAVASAAQLNSGERVLLNQAVSLISLLMDRPGELVDAHREVGAIVFDLLLAQAPAATPLLSGFGIGADEPVRVIWIGMRARELSARVAQTLADLGLPHLVTEHEDGLAVLVRSVDGEPAAAALADKIPRRAGTIVGLGRESRPDQTPAALASARQALGATPGHDRVARFDDLTLRSVLTEDAVRERLIALIPPALADLLESGASRDQELVASLTAYVEHNGAADPAARARGIHRHTLRGHVQRVEELTGLSFEDPETRTMTHLALLTR